MKKLVLCHSAYRLPVAKARVVLPVGMSQGAKNEDQMVSTSPRSPSTNTFCSKWTKECGKAHDLITGTGAEKPQE